MNQIPVKFQWLGILCLWLLGPRSLLLAQQRVQVVTKTVEKQFDYQPGETLRLEGEKAAITVTGWQGKKVKVILKLIAKAPAQETARRELDFQRYILEKRKEVIHLKNYFVLPKGQKALHAILLAEYEVWVPYQATIAITNTYGNVQVTKKGGRTHIDLKYGNTTLAEVEGVGHYNSYFGDFTAKNISGVTRGRHVGACRGGYAGR